MAAQRQLQTDEDEVLAANRAFYEALHSLDLAQMDAIWLHEAWVRCLHPGWELLLGWEEIQRSWADIFRSTAQMMVSISRPLVHVSGDTAWVSCLQNVTSTYEDGFSSALVEATNIFVRRQGRWLIVHHHTTPLPGQDPSGASRTVQ
jgi:ketosteroid isomerase-like protein